MNVIIFAARLPSYITFWCFGVDFYSSISRRGPKMGDSEDQILGCLMALLWDGSFAPRETVTHKAHIARQVSGLCGRVTRQEAENDEGRSKHIAPRWGREYHSAMSKFARRNVCSQHFKWSVSLICSLKEIETLGQHLVQKAQQSPFPCQSPH